ncbi:CD63 antigen-like [Paramacrobiotus metropolitanus]|uniref:CD63 antigen-like n=1 Tax=Paramacrobiotus metropolitanus TaxID=2943436 RepID=UPI0024463D96|nr:CD63 antigen-like [Paramacrobiotus metropolitanus]XP_055345579.1 CD63 antigen-like [Paramacrobiotus metropolitanus]XP_055345587.1 CD63 antigen-like [Paramacrobiotus metropolitanus]XP_055345595.1 CD63 antigen-like [Paramacrobiotus metropolitanus]XP_055345604.1 CD63 antigen-like [Paramacrobiotus metropolitanus]XP_055345613.1 CD63 antigen-like [Paramacrobiotus metropolitanus]
MGCFGCLKYILVIFSILYIFIGLGLLAVALWMRFDYLKEEEQSFNPGTDYFDIALYIAMSIGCFLVLLGIMGCVGALRISLCLLGNFAVMIVAAIGGLIAVAVLSYTYQDEVMKITDRMIRDLVMMYGTTRAGGRSVTMDLIQQTMKCCGVNSYMDWTQLPAAIKAIPVSCCRDMAICNPNFFVPTGTNFGGATPNNYVPMENLQILRDQLFSQGCADKIRSGYAEAMKVIVGLSGGIAGFMLLGFIFCVAFCCVM